MYFVSSTLFAQAIVVRRGDASRIIYQSSYISEQRVLRRSPDVRYPGSPKNKWKSVAKAAVAILVLGGAHYGGEKLAEKVSSPVAQVVILGATHYFGEKVASKISNDER
jgi:hypothetical protein